MSSGGEDRTREDLTREVLAEEARSRGFSYGSFIHTKCISPEALLAQLRGDPGPGRYGIEVRLRTEFYVNRVLIPARKDAARYVQDLHPHSPVGRVGKCTDGISSEAETDWYSEEKGASARSGSESSRKRL